jgi:hypothetical protein
MKAWSLLYDAVPPLKLAEAPREQPYTSLPDLANDNSIPSALGAVFRSIKSDTDRLEGVANMPAVRSSESLVPDELLEFVVESIFEQGIDLMSSLADTYDHLCTDLLSRLDPAQIEGLETMNEPLHIDPETMSIFESEFSSADVSANIEFLPEGFEFMSEGFGLAEQAMACATIMQMPPLDSSLIDFAVPGIEGFAEFDISSLF